MYYGFNGENWFQAQDEVSKQWIIDATPEGGTFTLRFRADKDDFDIMDISKLADLHISFQNAGKHLAVIYCINIKDIPTVQITGLNIAIGLGVDVIAVEFGNEVYAQQSANFDFNVYKNWFEPFKTLIEQQYPNLPLLVFLAPRPKESGVLGGRNDHSAFNDAAIDYINAHSNVYPTIHIYMNSRECPVLITPPAQRIFDPSQEYTDLTTFYETLVAQSNNTYQELWNNTLNYISQRIPGKGIYVTEWGYDNYGDIKNTIGVGNFAWHIWTKYGVDNRIVALLQHNGLSMAMPGCICPKHKTNDTIDTTGSNNRRRVDYWIYKMYRKVENNYFTNTTITTPGIYYIPSFIDMKGVVIVDPKLKIVSNEVQGIGGANIYSSSGATEWMSKNSTPTYEVAGISALDSPYSFGYNKVVVDVVLAVNEKPTAVATAPSSVYVGGVITLDASSSFDEDGNIVGYEWVDEQGRIMSTDKVYSFTALKAGTFSYLLIVEDDKGEKAYDDILIEVKQRSVKPSSGLLCKLFPWLKICKQ